jgi:hypothetical protein
MQTHDPQLIQRIAEQVIRALMRGGELGSSNTMLPATVNPPLGQCTAEDAPSSSSSSSSSSSAAVPRGVTVSQPTPKHVVPLQGVPVLDGIITANQLADALEGSPDGTVTLSPTARLTPMAQDRVRREPGRFRRASLPNGANGLKELNHGLPWMWWTCGRCPAVGKIVEQRRSRLLPMIAPREPSALGQAVSDLSNAVSNRGAAGGLLFVSSGTKPMMLANRCRSLRAVLGHCDDAVRQGLSQAGANVLVLEFPFTDDEAMARRVDLMLSASSSLDPAFNRMLHSVEGGRP